MGAMQMIGSPRKPNWKHTIELRRKCRELAA